ncbi:hypothetical protein HN695_07515 [Candidatus Woesearchaeota archaeon]|jgi:hypothetical protein|nr:hypothetical protein [Candidatus Woesearchaeota archaeon]MBT5272654.1 hypothetical protein [Candidatus Woesearchaeota archaeon]MBT6041709.1 hypothetical protein [Candidatus Woesearchaeota archaeon]MBT6337206.1 hypothetical protein [Candidatus Woesearchaeota archaeon]MBT7928156.1 hypothetical protein [Candidatus Woesearchaeota archaeon]
MPRSVKTDTKKAKKSIDLIVDSVNLLKRIYLNRKNPNIPSPIKYLAAVSTSLFLCSEIYEVYQEYIKIKDDVYNDQTLNASEKREHYTQTIREGIDYLAENAINLSGNAPTVNIPVPTLQSTEKVKVNIEDLVKDGEKVIDIYTNNAPMSFLRKTWKKIRCTLSIVNTARRIYDKYLTIKDKIDSDTTIAPADKKHYFKQTARIGVNHFAETIIKKYVK